MTPRGAAERIAESTWHRIGASRHLHARLGEETLTDLLVLDLLASAPSSEVQVVQTTKRQEARQGTDLVVYVRRDTQKADIYAIQAKKLGGKGRYDHLKSRAGQTQRLQIDVLERYAKQIKAIPLYLLFNYVDSHNAGTQPWHCCQQPPDTMQFGCTLVPSWRIRDAISTRRGRTFSRIHADPAVLPWRCAFGCPNHTAAWGRIREKAEESYHQIFSAKSSIGIGNHSDTSFSPTQYEGIDFRSGVGEWPRDLWDRGTTSLLDGDRMRFYEAQISGSLFFPRWLVLVNGNDRS